MVACAAIVALAVGGGTVFGGLGGLFGRSGTSLQVAERGSTTAADIVAAPNAADRAALARRLAGDNAPAGKHTPRSHGRSRKPTGGQPPSRAPSQQPSPVGQVPGPPPQLPPTTPTPSPGGGQVVTTVGGTVKQVTDQAPPPLQPVTKPLNDAVDNVLKTCQGLPVCP
jgi:hypothetical protein